MPAEIDPNERVTVTLPRAAWQQIVQIIWQSATCQVGNPLLEALKPQLEQSGSRNGEVTIG